MAVSGEGKRFGHFRTVAQLGAGAQGAVYKAVSEGHPSLPDGTVVALKVIPQQAAGQRPDVILAAYRPLLGREIHPSLVRYLDAFLDQADGKSWICAAMEHVEGRPLTELIREKPGGLIWNQAWPILRDALDGFAALSAAGLTHRDVKPGNILLTADRTVKIIDLDLLPSADAGGGADEDRTVAWQGSLEYMAPDFVNLKGFSGDEQSDVFSFAVLAFELLTGERPFGDLGDRPDLAYVQRWRKGNDAHPDFRHSPFRILDGLQSPFQKALEQDRALRTRTFAELRASLEKVRARVLEFQGGESYELIDLLGRGGFGEVYKARRVRDGQIFAVKHLHSQEYSKRFLKEASILREYAHPNIVGYGGLHSRESRGEGLEYFLVMEFLEGDTLSQRIKDNPQGLPPREVMRMFTGYCQALHHLHASEHQIIHRDIKPGNLFAPAGHPENAKLFDMGIARDVSGTQTFGHIPGTLNYMAPEFAQPEGGRGTPQSDIYALGFCLYEALVGDSVVPKLPRDLDQAYIAFFKRSQRPLVIDFDKPVFREFPGLMRVVARSIAYDPASRYATAEEMRKDLENVLNPPAKQSAADFSVTLSQVVSPKLVITRQWADENMKDWDESKFVPAKLPSEVGHDAPAAGRGMVYALIAALVIAIGAAVYLKFIKPPEVVGVNEEWAAQLLRESAAAREASTVPELEAVLSALAAMRAQPDAAKSAADLDAIGAALRARTLALASNLYAEATGLVSRAEYDAAAERAAPLAALADFASRGFQETGPAAWVRDVEERTESGRKLLSEWAAAKAAMSNRLTRALADVQAGGFAAARRVADEITAVDTAEWARTAGTPDLRPTLEALRMALQPVLAAEIERRDDPAGRAARLADLAGWQSRHGRVLDVSGLAQRIEAARRLFVWEVTNPTDLDLTLESPLIPAGTSVAAGRTLTLTLTAEQAAEAVVTVRAGDAHDPVPLTLAVKGGAGATGTLPKPGFRAIALTVEKAEVPAGTPPVRVTLRGREETAPRDPPAKLAPGDYTVRFERPDYEPVEVPLAVKPGQPPAVVTPPAHAAWKPAPALAQVLALSARLNAGESVPPAALEDARFAALGWPAHQSILAEIRRQAAERMLAAIPVAVEGAAAAVEDFLAHLVQVRDPMSAARARFRAAEPYAGPAPALALPEGWQTAAIPAEVRARIGLVQPFVAQWPGLISGSARAEVAAALAKLGTPLATDASAALQAAFPVPAPATGNSWLAHRWRAHTAFERDFVSADKVLAELELFQKAGGRANAHDALLGAWAAYTIWNNAVESVKDDTRLGGKRHTAESEAAQGALKRLGAALSGIPGPEMETAVRLLIEKAGATANLKHAHLLALTGLAKARLPDAARNAVANALDREKSAFEAAAAPADQAAMKRRLANLNYLLLDSP